jgi:hypothetical protein
MSAKYLAIRSQGFSKALRVCLAVLFILAVGVVGWLYYLKIEGDKQEELSRRLIRPDEIVFTDTLLGQSFGSWRVKGNVTNRSAHELSGFTIKIEVQECPVSWKIKTWGPQRTAPPEYEAIANQRHSQSRAHDEQERRIPRARDV